MIILRQKNYARKDYEGLSFISKLKLNNRRGEIAKGLKQERNIINITAPEKDFKKFLYDNQLSIARTNKEEALNNIRRSDLGYNIKKLFRK